MFNNLSDFYTSDEWRSFREIVINERTTEDGLILDEYTGKPILRRYDIILHHKIELTEENVNDYSISLNPDNIMIVSHKSHNLIHHKLGYSMRQVFIVYGSPLSGKTTFVKDNADEGDLILDIDNIWQMVSGLPRYQKPKRLTSVVFSVRDTIMDCIKYRRGKWNNAYIIGGYPLASERDRLRRDLGGRLVYIESSREKCLERLKEDPEGRDVSEWTRYIDEWFDRYIE